MRERNAVANRVKRVLPCRMWDGLPDTRRQGSVRYRLGQLMQLLVLGMMSGCPTLRDVETLGHRVADRRGLGLKGTLSDSRLYEVLREMPPQPVHEVLSELVYGMVRSKQVEDDEGLGLYLIAVDGKRAGTSPTPPHPDAWKGGGDEDSAWYKVWFLRAVHVSSAVKPALGQWVVRPGHGESDTFQPFLEWLVDTYGALVDCISVDAAFLSQLNAAFLVARNVHFIGALKGNQGNLLWYAQRTLGAKGEEPPGGWQHTTVERKGVRVVTRRFARVSTAFWKHHGWGDLLEQAWRIRQEVWDGRELHVEERYFLTSLPWLKLTPAKCMRAVRLHWGIENDCNWTLDMQLGEDVRPWVRTGLGAEVLATLRLIAYNVLRLLRHRTLRSEAHRKMTWRDLITLVRDAIVSRLPTLSAPWEPGFG